MTSSIDKLLAKFFPKVLHNMDSLFSIDDVNSESRIFQLADVTCACSLLWARHLLTSISIQANPKWKQEAERQLEELQGEIDRFAHKELLRSVQKYLSFHFTNHVLPKDNIQ